jgi:hypothetical protein
MSKRSKERRRLQDLQKQRQAPATPSQQQPAPPSLSTPINDSRDLEQVSRTASPVSETSPSVPLPDAGSREDLLRAIQSARQAQSNYERALKALAEQEEAIRIKRQEVETLRKQHAADVVTYSENQKALSEREKEIVIREENAKNGFLQERRQHLRQLQDDAADLRALIDETATTCAKQRVGCEKECLAKITQCEDVCRAKQAELILQEDALKQRERHIEIAEREKAWSEEDLQELANARASYEIEKVRCEMRSVDSRLKAAVEDAERIRAENRDLEVKIAALGGRNSKDLVSENTRLQEKCQELKDERDSRPSVDSSRQLGDLKNRCDEQESLIHDLRQDLMEQRRKADSAVIIVTDVETLRDQKLTLEKRCELLKNANETLREEYEQIITKAGQKTPFEACSAKDGESRLQTPPRALRDSIDDLPAFAEELRQKIAYDPETGKTLYYSIEDVRCFLAGLAMSRLHIVQGISGTGKTSLPKAFARAVGAGCELVPVQAGWRDREDLIGHYNSFQNKYYESSFLKALYDAQCAVFEDRLFIILLDEMNLSHPEQYFADFISLMEQDRDEQIVSLTTFPVPNAPAKFVEQSKLRIPNNVWFIGTANHDETTMDFADKTYDRAHVMELPRHRDVFPIAKRQRREDPLALDAFLKAVGSAAAQHDDVDKRISQYLDQRFLSLLGDLFNIGWGNRLERQLKDFAPMIMACGGSIGEATDHVLATKLLRKLRGRHDNTEKDLKEVLSVLDDDWIDNQHKPRKSRAVIEESLRSVT